VWSDFVDRESVTATVAKSANDVGEFATMSHKLTDDRYAEWSLYFVAFVEDL
jgi:hypothetical protein